VSIDDLVSPMATQSTQRTAAVRWPGSSGTIMLSDSMLNTNAGWGSGILTTVAHVLSESSPAANIHTIRRPQIGDHLPHEFIKQLVSLDVVGLVVTAGDCATCTSRALRECVLAEDAGIPATAVIPSPLTDITAATLSAWGRPDLQVAWMDKPLFQWRADTLGDGARPAAVQAWSILTGR
jgi:hypothetical protein